MKLYKLKLSTYNGSIKIIYFGLDAVDCLEIIQQNLNSGLNIELEPE